MAGATKTALTANAQTGNNTHPGVFVDAEGRTALVFVVEAVGATPTVTYKFQGSFVLDSVLAADWTDVAYHTDANDTTAVAAIVKAAVGSYPIWVANQAGRFYPYFRLVTSANTNVTYRAEAFTAPL